MKTNLYYVHFEVEDPKPYGNKLLRQILVGTMQCVEVDENTVTLKIFEIGNTYGKHNVGNLRLLAGFDGEMCIGHSPESQGTLCFVPPRDKGHVMDFLGIPVYSTNIIHDIALLPAKITNDVFWKMFSGERYRDDPVEFHGVVSRSFDAYHVMCSNAMDAAWVNVIYQPDIVELNEPMLDHKGRRIGLQRVCSQGHRHYVLFEDGGK